jgi:uncharacterized protein YndB with AHSA1/START domain
VRVSVRVSAPPGAAFRLFTEDIDAWWRRGPAFRSGGRRGSVIRLEPGVGGRFLESVATSSGTRTEERGRIVAWEPPARLVFEWRGANFATDEKTEVEVVFEASGTGTLVTVEHRGWSRIRADHPARHGLEAAAFVRMVGLWWGDLATSLRRHVASPA